MSAPDWNARGPGRIHDEGGLRTAPLAVGDVLHANPCEVVVTESTDAALRWGWCRTCRAAHILDAALFDGGRGPWRRVQCGDTGGAA